MHMIDGWTCEIKYVRMNYLTRLFILNILCESFGFNAISENFEKIIICDVNKPKLKAIEMSVYTNMECVNENMYAAESIIKKNHQL